MAATHQRFHARLLARLVDEPVVLFIVVGALLYGASALVTRAAKSSSPDAGALVISADFVRGLETRLRKRHGRAPTPEQLRGELARFVETELLYREALRLGLDRGDVIVRRRLAQKMRFVAEDFARISEPSERELAGYLARHAKRYRRAARLAFSQRFVARKRGETLRRDASELLRKLRAGVADVRGDSPPVAAPQTPLSPAQIARRFGERFAAELARLPRGQWGGPLKSAYGLHLVRVDLRVAGRDAKLAEVHRRVRADLLAERERLARRRFIARLAARFGVRYETSAKARLGRPERDDRTRELAARERPASPAVTR